MSGAKQESFSRAVMRFSEALSEPETAMNRDASIQRFEFSFELAWKAVQEALRDEGADCRSPKSCLREAFRLDWIDDEVRWLAMIDDRNLASHTYDEKFAKVLYRRLPDHLAALEALSARLRER